MRFDNATFETAFGNKSQLVKSDLPEVAFSGRSNVGKSTLINKIFNRKNLARVSSSPGKTATINFYRCGDVRMVDLPGYGYAKVSDSEKRRWSDLMQGYFNGERNIRLTVQLVDMRHSPTKDDIMMLNFLSEMNIPFIIALTKSDKLNKREREERLSKLKDELSFLDDYTAIPFSALKNEGVEEIRNQIEKALTE